MKTVTIIVFRDEKDFEENRNRVCEKLSALSDEKEFCGIWMLEDPGALDEVVTSISTTVNYFIDGADKTEVFFGCGEIEYQDILAKLHTENCVIKRVTCQGL